MKKRPAIFLFFLLSIVALIVAGPVCDQGGDDDDDVNDDDDTEDDDAVDDKNDDDTDDDDNDTLDDDDDVNPTVDWCGIIGPTELVTEVNEASEMIFGRIEITGVTGNGSPQPYVTVELGYAQLGLDPNNWTVMGFNEDHYGSGTDEYGARLLIGQPQDPNMGNTYNFVMRVSTGNDDGDDQWTYCDTGLGSADGFDEMDMGRIFVDHGDVDWCETTSPESVDLNVGEYSEAILGQAQIDGFANPDDLWVELGYGPQGVDPRTWPDLFHWGPAGVYGTAGDDILFSDFLYANEAGNYSFVFVVAPEPMLYTYCDLSPGTSDGFSVDDLGEMTVSDK